MLPQATSSHSALNLNTYALGYSWFETRDIRALILSLLAHLLVLLLLLVVPNTAANSFKSSSKDPIPVRLVREKSTQIVPPSDQSKEIPPEDSTQIAERDSTVELEMLKRGDDAAQGDTTEVQASTAVRNPAPVPTPEQQEVKEETKRSTAQPSPQQESNISKATSKQPSSAAELTKPEPILQLSPSDISRQLAAAQTDARKFSKENGKPTTGEARLRSQTDYTPFRQSISPSLAGRSGSSDYLPTIQDGELTLLNAKADRYAVFVRRVALQVFGILRQMSWTSLSGGQINQLQQFSEVRAILSANGDLERIELGGSSGVKDFDTLLQQAAQRGAWDQNPPEGAQSTDGKIHFIFRAKSWARPAVGGAGEQRWLLLSTGLL